MPSRRARLASVGIVAVLVTAACTVEHAFQGDPYVPEANQPLGEPSLRADTGVTCEGSGCDASVDAPAPPDLNVGSPPTNTCATARDLGRVSGDTVSPSIQTTGTCSEWLRFRATEDDSGIFGTKLSARFALTSDDDVDLYVYLNPGSDTLSCDVPYAVASNVGAGGQEITDVTWGDSLGSEDGRTISVLVLFARSKCTSKSTWSLVIDGNR